MVWDCDATASIQLYKYFHTVREKEKDEFYSLY